MKNVEKKTYLVSFVNCQFKKHENIPVVATSREDAETVLLRAVNDAHFVYDVQQSSQVSYKIKKNQRSVSIDVRIAAKILFAWDVKLDQTKAIRLNYASKVSINIQEYRLD